MPAKPSRDMLTAGVVGSYLLAASWSIVLLGAIVAVLGGIDSWETGWIFGIFGVIAGLIWIGGAICEGIGWIALGRVYPGVPALIGWLEASLPGVGLLVVTITAATRDPSLVLAHLLLVIHGTHLLLALIWMLRHGPRSQTLAPALGYGLALTSGLVLYALAILQLRIEAGAVVFMFAYISGSVIAHLGTAIVLARSRAIVDSINTF